MPNPSVTTDTVSIALGASPATQSEWKAIGNPTELGLIIPALSPNATVTVKVATDASGTNAQAMVDGTGTAKLTFASGAGGFAISSNEMGACLGYSHISVVVGTAQTTGKTFVLTRKMVSVDPSA